MYYNITIHGRKLTGDKVAFLLSSTREYLSTDFPNFTALYFNDDGLVKSFVDGTLSLEPRVGF